MRALILLAAVVLLSFTEATLASVSATLDRNKGAVGAPLLLTLEVQQSGDATLDLAPLEDDFTVLGRRHNALSSFKRGQTVYTQRWLITLSPRRAGLLTIPALSIGGETSAPLRFEALANGAHSSGPILLSSSLDPPLVYSRSATTLSVRLFYQLPLTHAELTEPQIEGVTVLPLGEQRYFREQKQGQLFNVIEQRYLLFPNAPGRYQVPALQFSGRDDHDQPLEAHAKAVPFEALALPAVAADAALSATELRLSARWDDLPATPRAGDTLTRTLVLEGHNIPADWLPRLSLNAPASVRIYPQPERSEQRSDSGVLVARLELPFRLLVTEAGPLRFPPLQLAWWDSVRESLEQTELAAETLTIAPFMAGADTTPQIPPAEALPAPSQAGAGADLSAAWSGWLWALLALICGAGWTLARGRVKQLEQELGSLREQLEAQRQQQGAASQQRQRELQAFEQLEQCCLQGDPAAAYPALLEWAGQFWPDEPVTTLADLERLAQEPTLHYLLRDLAHQLRSRDDEWHGDLLARQILRLRERVSRNRHAPPTQPGVQPHVEA